MPNEVEEVENFPMEDMKQYYKNKRNKIKVEVPDMANSDKKCFHCKAKISQSTKKIDQRYYCSDCKAFYVTKCKHCGKYHVRENMIQGCDTGWVCQTCFKSSFKRCQNCGKAILLTNVVRPETRSGSYCKRCYNRRFFKCNVCGAEVRRGHEFRDNYNKVFCHTCYNEIYISCSRCSNTYEREFMQYDSNGHRPYCQSCMRSTGGHDHEIQNYNWTPLNYKTFGVVANSKELTMGFELEMESQGCNSLHARKVIKRHLKDFVYFKSDGSLSDGFEMVSHPFTFEWLIANKNKVKHVLDQLKNLGWRSYDTESCGIHIHMNKDSFTTTHLLKYLNFFYNNPEYIVRISQRKASKLSRWASLSDGKQDGGLKYKARHKTGTQKYTAVNLTHANTVEVRIFRGNLHFPSFMKNVEFIESTYLFTKECGMKTISVKGFNEYVKKNYRRFPNLWNFIRDKKLMPGLKAVPKKDKPKNGEENQSAGIIDDACEIPGVRVDSLLRTSTSTR